MFSTLPQRLYNIRLALGFKTQDGFGFDLGLKKGSISRWENEKLRPVELPMKHVETMRDKYGVNPDYILGKDSNMFLDKPVIVNESAEKYAVQDPAKAISERFIKQIRAYASKNNLSTNREIAQYLGHVSEDMLSKIFTGNRTASLDIIYNCGAKIQADFNYTMYGVGSLFFSPNQNKDAEIVRLNKIIDTLIGNDAQSKSA